MFAPPYQGEGYETLIAPEAKTENSETDSEIRKIEQEYLKRRKWHMLEWGLIILAVFIYLVIRSR